MSKNHIVFIIFSLTCLTPWVSSPTALVIGFLFSSLGLVPHNVPISKITKKLLAYSIVGLGFGIHFREAVAVTSDGIGLIIATIAGTLILGSLVSKHIGLDKNTGYLISVGTSICGGSAIAAVSPAIKASDEQTALALATVFVLNSVALFVFPAIGHSLELDQQTFGSWAAIAIHDTSSVVGAASAYGEEALKTATTLKLARAFWIIPVALLSALLFKNKNNRLTIPYFIFFYCFAIFISDYFPSYDVLFSSIFQIAKRLLVVCLFLIGCSISVDKIKAAGAKPLLFGVGLWAMVSVSSLTWLILS